MRILSTLAVVLAFAAAAPAAHGQVGFGMKGGPTMPSGDLEGWGTGYQGGLALEISLPVPLVGLRADAEVHRFSGPESNLYQANVTGGARVSILSLPRLSLYGVAGGGAYYSISDDLSELVRADLEGEDPTDHIWGVNGGVGAELPGLVVRPFVEVRYHRMLGDYDSMTFTPVSVGLMF